MSTPEITNEAMSENARWVDAVRHPMKSQGRGKPRVEVKQPPMSALGCTVADILAAVYGGMHNAPMNVEKVEWDHPHCVVAHVYGGLASVDNNRLTRLVILCHDHAVRLDIDAGSPRHLRLMFHQRKRREPGQCGWEGCPTIEQAIEGMRKGTR